MDCLVDRPPFPGLRKQSMDCTYRAAAAMQPDCTYRAALVLASHMAQFATRLGRPAAIVCKKKLAIQTVDCLLLLMPPEFYMATIRAFTTLIRI